MKYIEKSSLSVSLLLAILLLFGLSQSHAKIVFSSKQKGDTLFHIYVMEDNGSNVRRITSTDFFDLNPRWFPDGKRILFERDWSRGDGGVFNSEFYIIDANGRNEHNFMENHPIDFYPALSPDGKQVAFKSRRSGESEIYTYHLESGQLRQLTDNRDGGHSHRMDWSPDGSKIAYEHDTVAEGSNIWIMNADGSRKWRLSPRDKGIVTFLNRGAPRWSPSGKYIMYDEQEQNNKNWKRLKETLVVQNVNTGVRAVHKFPLKDLVLTECWMGNDQTVLLPINRNFEALGAKYEIYRYDLVSRRLTNLTNQPGGDYGPHWIRGSLAVFPAGKLTTLWGQLKQVDPYGWSRERTH